MVKLEISGLLDPAGDFCYGIDNRWRNFGLGIINNVFPMRKWSMWQEAAASRIFEADLSCRLYMRKRHGVTPRFLDSIRKPRHVGENTATEADIADSVLCCYS